MRLYLLVNHCWQPLVHLQAASLTPHPLLARLQPQKQKVSGI
jgi:hypothetical protein